MRVSSRIPGVSRDHGSRVSCQRGPLAQPAALLTEAINFGATVRLAEMARDAGVRRFVYASSQSMYGISTSDRELDEDDSEKNPLTAYARTKWQAEQALKALSTDDFAVVCF